MSRSMSIPGATSSELQPSACAGNAALGDVEHRLPRLGGVRAVEGDLLDALHELALALPFAHDVELAVLTSTSAPPP